MNWTEEKEALLRELWMQRNPTLSTIEIARRLNLSKNAIVSKADRMDLEERPSPIRKRINPAPPAKPKALKAGAKTLPPLGSLS